MAAGIGIGPKPLWRRSPWGIKNISPLQHQQRTLQHDPLYARPAHANWHQADAVLARGIVYRLGGFFTLADIQRIDRHLSVKSQSEIIKTRKSYAKCFIESNDQESHILSCGNDTDSASLRARIEIETDQSKVLSARILRLQIPGDANIWQPNIFGVVEQPGRFRLLLGKNEEGLSPRLSNGDRIHELNLYFDKFGDTNLEIIISAESIRLDQMLASILHSNQKGSSDSLSSLPFRRRAIVTDLSRQDGFKKLEWIDLPRPSTPTQQQVNVKLPGSLALLQPYCAHCHSDDSKHPPGFLSGSRPDLKIQQCAPRILARLKAWQPGFEIPKSPMPPSASLAISASNAEEWPNSDHYHSLISAIEGLLRQDFSGIQYDDLPHCLSEG